jgi:hypothetical protein
VPRDQHTWIRREAVSFEGTAPDKDAAIAAWKEHWPKFRDARTKAEWREIKESQNRSHKQNLRYDYLNIRGRLSARQCATIEAELAADGPVAAWLVELLAINRTA